MQEGSEEKVEVRGYGVGEGLKRELVAGTEVEMR